jgi:hypothetical protein
MLMAMVMMMMMVLIPPRILVDTGLMYSASSPSGSLPEVMFHKLLVSLCVGPLFRLHGVGAFDEAKPPTLDTVSDIGGLCSYGCLLKFLVFALTMAFLPSA